MKNLKLIVKFLKQNIIKNTIIIIQISLSIYVFTILLTQIINYKSASSMLSKMDLNNTVIFTESLHISNLMPLSDNRTEKYENIKKYLNNLKGVADVYNVYSTEIQLEEKDIFTVMYDDGLLERLNFNLKTGENFSEKLLNDEIIPIIISEGLEKSYKLNDIYKLSIYSIPNNEIINMKVKVIGILRDGAYIYSGDTKQTLPQVTDLFVETYENEELIIMPNRLLSTQNFRINSGFMVEISDKTLFMRESYNKVIEDGIGKFIQEDEYGNNFFNNFIANYDYYIYIFIATYVFVLISVGGYNLLATLNYRRLLTVYYINGMTWRKGITLIALRNLIIVIIPTLITSILCNLSMATNNGIKFNYEILIITIILYLIVFLLTTIGTISSLINTKPSEVLKEVE